MENDFEVAVEVHKSVGFGYRVKVLVHDIGIFINGFIVMPPNDEHDWAVYPPLLGWAGRGKRKYTVEFNKKYPLWDEIYWACIEAVKSKMGLDDSIDGSISSNIEDDSGYM